MLSNLTNQDTTMGLGYKRSGLRSTLVLHEIHDDADAELHADTSDNRDFLENPIGSEVSHFAYPYGTDKARGVRELYTAKRRGFKSAATAPNRSRPWKQQACFAEAQSQRPILDQQRRLDNGYPKSAPPRFHSPSAERKFL